MASAKLNAPKSQGPVSGRLRPASAPDRVDAREVLQCVGGKRRRKTGVRGTERPRLTQRGEAGVHFRGQRSGAGACRAVARPGGAVGKFIQVFADRERFPDHEFAVEQHRHATGRRVVQDPFVKGRGVEAQADLLEWQTELAQREPGAKRPRRQVTVAQDQSQHARIIAARPDWNPSVAPEVAVSSRLTVGCGPEVRSI